jgi:Fe-S cluster assembly protein SufD
MSDLPKKIIVQGSVKETDVQLNSHSIGIQREITDPGIRQYRSSALENYVSGDPLIVRGENLAGFDLPQLDDKRLRLAISPGSEPLTQKRIMKKSIEVTGSFSGYWGSGPEEAIENLVNKETAKGVIFTDLLSAEKQYPELLSKILGKIIKPGENKFAALAAALGQFGLFIYVPTGIKIAEPFYYQNMTARSGDVGLTQLLVYLEPEAEMTLIQHQMGGAQSDETVQVGTTEIMLERGARMKFHEIVDLPYDTWSILQEKALVGEDAELTWTVAAFGNRFNKQVFNVDLAGENSRCNFSGFSLTGEHQQFESVTHTRHLAPYSESELILKNVLFADGRAKWSGMVKVEPEAIHSDGYQVNRNLILSNDASVESIPGLEILTNEVRCSHGSTTGRIDPEELFYLQSRGISIKDSQKLLVEGFIEPILKQFPEKTIQKQLIEKVQKSVIKKIL